MLYYFAQLNLKLLLVIIVFGMIMSKTRQIASQNFSKKASGYYIMDFFNLVGTPVHEFGHLFFGLLFGLPKPELQNQQQADRRKGQPLRGLPHGRASEHIARQRYRQINTVAAQNGGIFFVPCALFVIFIGIQLEHVHQI